MAQKYEEPEGEPIAGTPRWVKMSGLVIIILVVVVIALRLAGLGGDHGPNRHMSSAGGQVAPLQHRA